MPKPYAVELPEMDTFKVCWETCSGGIVAEQVYMVSEESVNMEQEGFIGFLLDVDFNQTPCYRFKSKPHRFVYDGLLYAEPAKKEDLKRWKVTAEDLETHRQRMKALETLLNTTRQLNIKAQKQRP